MEEMFWFMSERERKILEHNRAIVTELYTTNPCFDCPYYDEYAGCIFDPIDEEWYCYKEREANTNEKQT